MRERVALLALTVVVSLVSCQLFADGESTDYVAKRIFLKFPSSFVNLTSDSWKLQEDDDQVIVALKFEANSVIGQLYSIRFIRPDGVLEATLTAGIRDGFLDIDMFDSEGNRILDKPAENVPINLIEQNLALGLNTTSRTVWFRIGSSGDVKARMSAPIDIAKSELVVTLGGGGQAVIGCVSLVAVSVGGRSPVAEVLSIGEHDTDNCPAQNECSTRDCNKGRCKLLEVPVCDCYATEMTGPNCRRPGSSVKLRNNDDEESSDWIRYTPWMSARTVERITMDFKFADIEVQEGVLVHGITTDKTRNLKIYVVGRKGNVAIGSDNILDFDLAQLDGFHTIIVKLSNETLSLFVDNDVQRIELEEPLEFETIQFGAPIANGGVTEVGVTACVKNVYVDHLDVINLVYSKDPKASATRVRPCIEGDDFASDIAAVPMFSPDPVLFLDKDEDISDKEDDKDLQRSEVDDSMNETPDLALTANLFPLPPDTNVKKTNAGQCEKSQEYLCQNKATCEKTLADFRCVCQDGIIGKFCQFSTHPRSCAEARDFHKMPAGPTKIDPDGSRGVEPSVALCIDGTTVVPHDMKADTALRDAEFSEHSLFVVGYRDFKSWQLSKLVRSSATCTQSISYKCNKAPLLFETGKTWFKSALEGARVQQIGSLNNSCTCIDHGCKSGAKCNCDSGAITEDTGVLSGANSAITEIVALRTEGDVRGTMSLGDLNCSGYEKESEPIRFVERIELEVSDWTGESLYLQFRTNDASATVIRVTGRNDKTLVSVNLLDGHTIGVSHLDTVRTIQSQTRINDSAWHQIIIEPMDGEIRFSVDDSHVTVPIEDDVILTGKVVLSSVLGGMIGCVRSLRINDAAVDLHRLVENKSGIKTTCETQCTASLCQNGAKCFEDFATESAFCQCTFPGIHSGKTCEIDINTNSSVSFHGGHLRFERGDDVTALTSSVFFSFRTDQSDALLLFAHDHLNNFLQVHLSEEVNLTLTLNNQNIVYTCSVRAQKGTEFGDMRWVQVAISHTGESSQLRVDDAACSIRMRRSLSKTPIHRLLNVRTDIVRLPVGLSSPANPDPFGILFVAGVDTSVYSDDGSIVLSPRYDTNIPRLLGCMRGLQVGGQAVDLRTFPGVYRPYDPALIRIGCDVGCGDISCGSGHCSVAWTNYDPTAPKTTCDCSRTSYAGSTCSVDDGIHVPKGGWMRFDVGRELSRVIIDKSTVPQIFKFAFSTKKSEKLKKKQQIATIKFVDGRQFEIEINPNGTMNVGILWENGHGDVLNFEGNFVDGYRHFVVAQFSPSRSSAVMVDSMRQDFTFKSNKRNLDLFSATSVKIGLVSKEESDEKEGYEGCVSNILIDFQRGSSLAFTPIGYLNNLGHDLHHIVSSNEVQKGACAPFLIPNSIPVYQNRVEFPVWDTNFARQVYRGEIPNDGSIQGEEDESSLFWLLIIIVTLISLALLLFCIFLKCCRESSHSRHIPTNFDEEEHLNMLPLKSNIYRPPQPSPPIPKKSAASNYHLPPPNIDFNKDEPVESDDDILNVNDEFASDDDATIRHIDEDDDDLVVVSRPTQMERNKPVRMSSFRNGDSTAPRDSPLYQADRPVQQPVQYSIPVPPPRLTPSPKL